MLLKLVSKCNNYNNNVSIQALTFAYAFRCFIPFSTTSTATLSNSFANYLVTSLGFSKKQSIATFSKLSRFRGTNEVDINFASKATSVIDFLKEHGFDQCRIKKVVSFYPPILIYEVDKTLEPNIKLLQDLGLSGSDLVRVISTNPVFLIRQCSPAITALRFVMATDEDVISVIKLPCWFAICSNARYLIPNVTLVKDCYNISIDLIRKHMLKNPGIFLLETELFRDVLSRTENRLGIPPHDSMFLYGVRVLVNYKEANIESKWSIFKDFGWTDTDVMVLIRQNPIALSSSVIRIKKCLEVLMNDLGYEPSYLAKHNFLFTCSIEKRVVPRHKILADLRDKGFLRTNYPFPFAMVFSEAVFFKRFVQPFQEVHELYAKLTGRSVELLIQGASIDGK